jgi:hypothetical protein
MKRQILAIALGTAFALPAFANNEINAGNLPGPVAATKSIAQVQAELVAAQRAGDVIVNAELGTTAAQDAQHAGKTRAEVRAEVVAARRSGDYIVNAELGTTARQL